MTIYRADLHIHTVLSPCGDLEMSPRSIIAQAKERGMAIIGISDHNSTLQSNLVYQLAQQEGILVLRGAEVTTKEEVHCLCFFEHDEELEKFQQLLENRLPNIPNNVDVFGYQVVVNEDDEILQEVEPLLISATSISIEELEGEAHRMNGIFIPAHINKSQNSVLSQLGFLPPDLRVDALELSRHVTVDAFLQKNKYLAKYPFIQSSDAHLLPDVGKVYTELQMESLSFAEVRMALHGENGRAIVGRMIES